MARQIDVQYIRYYTDGSSARQVAPMFSLKQAVLPKPRKQRRKVIRIDPVATLSIVVAVFMLLMMGIGIAEYVAVRHDAAVMEHYVAQLSAENAALRQEFEDGYDLEEVEKTALALGLVPKDQVRQVSIQVSAPVQQPTVTLWERIGTFLAGLFA